MRPAHRPVQRPVHRWAAVAAGTPLLVAGPVAAPAWPTQDRDVSGNSDIGQTTTVSGTALRQQQLIGRTFLALGYALVCMLGVAAIALFLSTVVDTPLGAALGTMAVLVARRCCKAVTSWCCSARAGPTSSTDRVVGHDGRRHAQPP